jgi:hypothetical protein
MSNDFIDTMWSLDYKQLTQFMSARSGEDGGDFATAQAILAARAAHASERAATSTFWLAIATGLLAVATVALALFTALD